MFGKFRLPQKVKDKKLPVPVPILLSTGTYLCSRYFIILVTPRPVYNPLPILFLLNLGNQNNQFQRLGTAAGP